MLTKSLTHLSVMQEADTKRESTSPWDPYATAAQSAAILQSGADFRRRRIAAADMVTTDEAADFVGVSRVTINAWIKQCRCIGVSNMRRGFKLPKWQFEPPFFDYIQPLFKALGTSDGWTLMAFLENSKEALAGRTPLVAMEQGESLERILALAMAEGH